MPETRKLAYSKTIAVDPVAGLRIAGRNRVYRFDQCCSKDGTVTIGRANDNNIRIRDDDTVSKLHCVIYKGIMGRYALVDPYSTNGVRISDRPPYWRFRKVTQHHLEVGMRIKLGGTRLIIVGPDGEPVIATSRLSLIGKVALSVFGNISAAANRIGLDHRKFKKIARASRSKPKDEGEEDE